MTVEREMEGKDAYLPFYKEAIKRRRTLPGVTLGRTNRENNTEADELSKRADDLKTPRRRAVAKEL